MFQKIVDKDVTFDMTGQPLSLQEHKNPADFERWSISTKMEFPILNFSQSLGDLSPDNSSAEFTTGSTRGMWWGYGQTPSDSEGVYLMLSEYEPTVQSRLNPNTRTSKTETSNLTGSLIDQCGFQILGAAGDVMPVKKLGQMPADFEKSISEAVVCVPFTRTKISGITTHQNFGGRYFFAIDSDVFYQQKQNIDDGSQFAIEAGQLDSLVNIDETSVSDLIKKMRRYILPPKFDFVHHPDKLSPFVMYMFEFEHKFTRQELMDIWQNVMPDIAKSAEVEEVTLSHPTGKFEFFHGQRPFSTVYADEDPEVEWMVFKVKQRAKTSYYELTENTTDDDKFKFKFQWGEMAPQYSYNWPYDFCSLVELAKVTTEIEIG